MSKITKQNVGGTDYTMVGCALTGVCASAADAFIKAVTLSDGDVISDGMTVIVTFANGNTAGTAPASKTIYSSDQVNYYEDTGLTVPFTLAPAGCYEITYTGTGNAYTYISYPVIQIGSITGVICDASGNTVSGSLWAKGAQIGIMFKDGKFLLISGALLNNMSALPTDAVLHYSFDEVPDYPDGTAVEKHIKDFTSVPSGWDSNNRGVLSVANGELINTMTNGTNPYIRRFYSSQSNGIIKIKIRATIDCSISISYYNGSSYAVLASIENARAGQSYILTAFVPIIDYILIQALAPTATDFQLILSEYYFGDGSYVTPIIDNANGQNNGTNNGGIAVQGVSGKSSYFPSANQRILIPTEKLPAPTSNDDITISLWLKIAPAYESDNTNARKTIAAVGEYNGAFGIIRTEEKIGFICRDSSAERLVLASMKKGSWHNYVGAYNGTTHRLSFYEDGILIGVTTANIADYQFGSGASNWIIWSIKVVSGNASSTVNQPATIDDLIIFNRALSEAEVMALYLNRANTPKYYSWADWKLQQMA